MANWWRDAVIYQVYPRSFQDDDGDGVGDLAGITRRLGYVADLGADAIWLSPIFTSPMHDMGYDVADYRDIDPLFGTLAEFDRLIETAHGLGLKVIVDQVLSHTSDRHEWFQASRQDRTNPKADWYVWADPPAGRVAAHELAQPFRRAGLGIRAPARSVLSAQLPDLAAGPELPRAGGGGRAPGRLPVLARSRA